MSDLPENFLNRSADSIAISEDIEHSLNCAHKLHPRKPGYDETEGRAFWESALVSLRRALANSSTMGPNSGGVASDVKRATAKEYIPQDLHTAFDELLYKADKLVAHRVPNDSRRVEVIENPENSGPLFYSWYQMPSVREVKELQEICKHLHEAVFQVPSDVT